MPRVARVESTGSLNQASYEEWLREERRCDDSRPSC